MNGAVEAASKNIKRIIAKMAKTYKDWHEKLSFAFYTYRTLIRTSTSTIPFSLIYGMKAVLPIKFEIPLLRVLMETKLGKAKRVKTRYNQLNLIKEKCIGHSQMHQRRMIQVYNKKMHPQ